MTETGQQHDIDDAALAHLERLARLVIEPEERESLRHDLVELLGFVDTLLRADVTGIEEYGRGPDLNAAGADVARGGEREDTVTPSLPTDVALELAPEAVDGFIKVPRTVEEG